MSTDKLNQGEKQPNFSSRSDSELHKESHEHLCDVCGETFACQSDLMKHMQSHKADPYPFKCDICGNILNTAPDMRRHMQQVHKVDPCLNFQFQCMYCENKYKTPHGLNIHISKSHWFPCPICDERFHLLRELEEHKLTHNNSFECKKCKQSFPQESLLKMHSFACTPKD